jgi:hypothetical protein
MCTLLNKSVHAPGRFGCKRGWTLPKPGKQTGAVLGHGRRSPPHQVISAGGHREQKKGVLFYVTWMEVDGGCARPSRKRPLPYLALPAGHD